MGQKQVQIKKGQKGRTPKRDAVLRQGGPVSIPKDLQKKPE